MKITCKVINNVNLELSQEQIKVLNMSREIITDIYKQLVNMTDYIEMDNTGQCILFDDLLTAADVLNNLTNTSSFIFTKNNNG